MFRRDRIRRRILEAEGGENAKNLETLAGLCRELIEEGISKCSMVIGSDCGCLTDRVGLTAGMI